MPTAIRIDTLKFARQLTDAGMDQRVAEALVVGLSEADTSELATKTDLKAEIARLEASTKQDFARVDAKISELKAEIFRAMLIQAGTIVGLTVALVKLLP
jgi:hypothetical protein